MSVLDDLKPRSKLRVIDLVREAGVNVSDWSNFKGGRKKAAVNPRYCYEWSFVEPGRVAVLSWWHEDLREEGGAVCTRLNLREVARVYGERKRNFVGQSFWARGYFVSTVGRDEKAIRDYIQSQEKEDQRREQLNLWK